MKDNLEYNNKKPKITFVARYYPPTPNINGEAICDMVTYLKEQCNIESNIICMDRSFEGGGRRREPVGNVIKLKSLSQSNNKILRFITFLYDGWALTRKSKRFKDTFIVTTSSPPLLPFWASMMYGRKYNWAFWSLDLFPEGFSATNMISENNRFYKWVIKKTYNSNPRLLIALGPKQHEHLERKFQKELPAAILPCGVFFYQDKSEQKPAWFDSSKTTFGYCGNIGDAHNPAFIREVANQIDPETQQIVLALYGHKAPKLKESLAHQEGIIMVETVPRDQLHFIDIHLVTLYKKWTHIAVPSKAISAVTMNGALLFAGSKESDNWHMLQDSGWLIEEGEDLKKQVTNFMNTLTQEAIEKRKQRTPELLVELQEMVLNSYNMVATYANQYADEKEIQL